MGDSLIYTVSNLDTAIETEFDNWLDFAYATERNRKWDGDKYVNVDPGADIPGIGRAVIVASEGGYEGGGEDYWIVIQIGERYFRREGYYYSYDGRYLDGPTTEVTPTEQTITVYVAV